MASKWRSWNEYIEIEITHGIVKNKRFLVKEYVHPVRDALTWANLVTFSGLLALLLVTYLIVTEQYLSWVPWLWGYGAAVSDGLDGLVAQWRDGYSRLGRYMDPVRDRYAVVPVLLLVYQAEGMEFLWIAPLFAVAFVEVLIAVVNWGNDSGSHKWGKRRYALHLLVMGQYIAQVCWPFWPELLAASTMFWIMLVGSAVALVDAQHRA